LDRPLFQVAENVRLLGSLERPVRHSIEELAHLGGLEHPVFQLASDPGNRRRA
jgi:hypothetical protein